MEKNYIQAQAYLQMHVGNIKAAEIVLAELDEQAKEEGMSQFLFGHLAMKQKHYSDAICHYEAAEKKGIKRGRLLIEVALAKAHLLEETQEALDILDARYADNPKYLYDVCRTLATEGKHELAEQILQEKSFCFENPFIKPMYKKVMATTLKKSGRVEEAISLWEELFEASEDRSCGVDLMAAFMKQGNYERALPIVDKLIEQHLEDHVHYYCLCCKVKMLKALDVPQTKDFTAEVHEKMKGVENEQLAELIRPLRLGIMMEVGDKEGAEQTLSEWETALDEADLSEEILTEERKKIQEVREALNK